MSQIDLTATPRAHFLAPLFGDDGTPILSMVQRMIDAYVARHGRLVNLLHVMEDRLRPPPHGTGLGLRPDAILQGLAEVQSEAANLGYVTTAKHVGKFVELVRQGLNHAGDLPADLKNIRQRLNDDAAAMMLSRVDAEHVAQYDKPQLFGDGVAAKFPDAQRDLTAAGTCYALGCSTAAAMHLMRAMESVLRSVAATIPGFPAWPKGTMGNIAKEIRKHEEHLPEGTTAEVKRKNAITRARMHLEAVARALRDPTMHTGEFWEMADVKSALFEAERFMRDLADAL